MTRFFSFPDCAASLTYQHSQTDLPLNICTCHRACCAADPPRWQRTDGICAPHTKDVLPAATQDGSPSWRFEGRVQVQAVPPKVTLGKSPPATLLCNGADRSPDSHSKDPRREQAPARAPSLWCSTVTSATSPCHPHIIFPVPLWPQAEHAFLGSVSVPRDRLRHTWWGFPPAVFPGPRGMPKKPRVFPGKQSFTVE